MAKNKLANRRKKEGLFWWNKRTGQLRASYSKDKPISYYQPLEVYKVGEYIRRGESVSIASEEDLPKIIKALGDKYDKSETYVVKTNTNYHKKSLGLALEPAEAGDELHIQNTGSFTFTKGADSELEYYPDFTDSDIGKVVYIKGTSDQTQTGLLTLDSEESWKEYRNIISIGSITDTPLEGSTQDTITISLNISGDQRGLIDATQIEMVVGEQFKVPLNNPIKVLAVGQEADTPFKATVSYKQNNEVTLSSHFLGFSRSDGKTAIIRFNNSEVPAVSETVDLKDLSTAFIRTAIYHSGSADGIKVIDLGLGDHSIENDDEFNTKIKAAITEALEYIGYSEVNITETKANNWINLNIEVDNAEVKFTQIHSSTPFFQTLITSTGSRTNKGKAVVADIRYGVRNEIAGIYASSHYDEDILKDTHIIVQREGLVRIPKDSTYKLISGEEYYLGFAGNIVIKNELPTYLSSVVKIGKAISETELVLDLGDTRQYPIGSLPIGYVKMSVDNVPEYGFLLCDGVTPLDAAKYPETLAFLRQFYTDEQLGIQTID